MRLSSAGAWLRGHGDPFRRADRSWPASAGMTPDSSCPRLLDRERPRLGAEEGAARLAAADLVAFPFGLTIETIPTHLPLPPKIRTELHSIHVDHEPLRAVDLAGVAIANGCSWRRCSARSGSCALDMAALWAACAAPWHRLGFRAVLVAYCIGYLATTVPMPAGVGVLDSGLAGALLLLQSPCARSAPCSWITRSRSGYRDWAD
jgi:hypothetical protein